MRGTPYLQGYQNGVMIRLKDRQLFVTPYKSKKYPDELPGYRIISKRINKHRYWKPARITRNKHNVVEMHTAYSTEALDAIYQAIQILKTNPFYNKVKNN